MPSQKLRLEAEMRDNASPAVKKLREELSELQKVTRDAREFGKLNKEIATLRKEAGDVRATPGMKAFNSWMGEAKGQATGFFSSMKDIPGILGAVGIGGIAAGSSVAGLAEEMKKLGERALDLKELSREVGMSVDFVNRFSHAGEHFGVTVDGMKGALNSFAGQLPDFALGGGPMFKEFGNWGNLVRKIQQDIKENRPADALMDALKQLEIVGKEKGPQVQKQVAEAMFPGHGADALKFMRSGLAGVREEMQKPWATPSQRFADEAQKLRDAGIDLNRDFGRLENTVAPGFIKVLRTGIDGVDLVVKGWVWEFQKIADLFNYLHNSATHGLAEPGSADDRKGAPAMPGAPPAIQLPNKDGGPFGHIGKKASYDGSGGLLQNASFVTGGTGSGTMTGAVSEGARSGVLQAFREAMLEQDLKDRIGGGGGGGAGDGGAGSHGGAFGGRRGFMGGGAGHGSGTPGEGGSRSWRNNNPGNIEYGPFAKSMGATGSDGRFAIFPGYETGRKAQEKLLFDSKGYSGLTLADAIRKWAPGSENNVPAYIAAMHADPNMHMSDFSAGQRSKLLDAMQAHEGWKVGTRKATGTDSLSVGGMGAGGAPVDIAMALRGAGNTEAGRALKHYMTSGLWCADFVNGALAKAGGKGTGSSLARSFFSWGHHVGNDAIRKGDVLASQGHVGFAEGPAAMHNGRMMVPMISGNHGHRVGESWEPLGKYEARRAAGPALTQAQHPHAGRRATGLDEAARGSRESGSDHRLTIALHDPGGHVKGTRIEKSGPMQIEMERKWVPNRNPLVGA